MNTQANHVANANNEAGQKQQLSLRLTLEVIKDGKICIYTFAKRTHEDRTSSRTVIDIWVEKVKNQTRDLPAGSIWYRLSDFSQTDMNPSPYLVARLSELSKYRPELKGFSAFVIPKNIFTQVMVNLSKKVRPRHIQVRLFFNRDEALQWLVSQLEASSKPAEKASVTK